MQYIYTTLFVKNDRKEKEKKRKSNLTTKQQYNVDLTIICKVLLQDKLTIITTTPEKMVMEFTVKRTMIKLFHTNEKIDFC